MDNPAAARLAPANDPVGLLVIRRDTRISIAPGGDIAAMPPKFTFRCAYGGAVIR